MLCADSNRISMTPEALTSTAWADGAAPADRAAARSRDRNGEDGLNTTGSSGEVPGKDRKLKVGIPSGGHSARPRVPGRRAREEDGNGIRDGGLLRSEPQMAAGDDIGTFSAPPERGTRRPPIAWNTALTYSMTLYLPLSTDSMESLAVLRACTQSFSSSAPRL